MGMAIEFDVASVRKILRRRDLWKPTDHPYAVEQSVVPCDWSLHEKMGLRPGAKVLFFAGGAGNWADALAKGGVEVHYSDASKPMVEHARKSFAGGGIKSFSRADAMAWPQKQVRYDRFVSFEPIPLQSASLPVAMLRAIAYSGGMTVAYGDVHAHKGEDLLNNVMRRFNSVYGAPVRVEEKRITAKPEGMGTAERMGGSAPVSFYHTDSPAEEKRRLARIDLGVLAAIGGRTDVSAAELAKKPTLAEFKLTE